MNPSDDTSANAPVITAGPRLAIPPRTPAGTEHPPSTARTLRHLFLTLFLRGRSAGVEQTESPEIGRPKVGG